MSDFSPWELLSAFTAWVLIIGLVALVVAAAVLLVMTAMQLHRDHKTDKELRKVIRDNRNRSKREHPSNQDDTHPEDEV